MLRMSNVMLRTLSNKDDDVPDVMSATKRCGVLILCHASVPHKKEKFSFLHLWHVTMKTEDLNSKKPISGVYY